LKIPKSLEKGRDGGAELIGFADSRVLSCEMKKMSIVEWVFWKFPNFEKTDSKSRI
jgi:hypothetical protein